MRRQNDAIRFFSSSSSYSLFISARCFVLISTETMVKHCATAIESRIRSPRKNKYKNAVLKQKIHGPMGAPIESERRICVECLCTLDAVCVFSTDAAEWRAKYSFRLSSSAAHLASGERLKRDRWAFRFSVDSFKGRSRDIDNGNYAFCSPPSSWAKMSRYFLHCLGSLAVERFTWDLWSHRDTPSNTFLKKLRIFGSRNVTKANALASGRFGTTRRITVNSSGLYLAAVVSPVSDWQIFMIQIN